MADVLQSTEQYAVQVAVAAPVQQLYTYTLPQGAVQVGMRVWVPLGPRAVMGWVVAEDVAHTNTGFALKKAESLQDPVVIFNGLQLQLAQWLQQYYLTPLGEVLAMMSPSVLLKKQTRLCAQDVAELRWDDTLDPNIVATQATPKQRDLLAMLRQAQHQCQTVSSCRAAGFSKATVQACVRKGWLERSEATRTAPLQVTEPVALTEAQQHAVEGILAQADRFSQHVLEGVTGSGKTEVYCAAIQAILQQGKQALVLVPEIGLTPQTVARFVARCGVKAVLVHSKLSAQQKLDAWWLAKKGLARLVIGTRSALFSPLAALGMIVVDESHDASFKQQSGCCYSARDVAMKWAQLNNIPIVVGTATPTLETLRRVQSQAYHHHVLSAQAVTQRKMTVKMVDMRGQRLEEGVVSRLKPEIQACLDAGKQVLLFLNRRGYSPVLLCHHCGWSGHCERCDTHMVVHQQPEELRCHQCNHRQPKPPACPACGASSWLHVGLGTQRLESLMQRWFPAHRCLRIDRDVTQTAPQLHQALDAIHDGACDIIIGTQMVAKGHDFKRVAMVAILDCDSHLFHPDFRAVERLAQMLVQVSGRAGRHMAEATIWIQTHHPQHDVFSVLSADGYHAWAQRELEKRAQCALPPYWYMATTHFHAHQPQKLQALPDILAPILQPIRALAGVSVVGPLPSLWPKRKGYWRYTLSLSGQSRALLHGALQHLHGALQQTRALSGVHWRIEVDPTDLG